MKGFIKQTAAAIGFSAALLTVLGCTHYRDLVDPCWPERYDSMARASVREMTNAQAAQGHKLDTTLWNTYFEADPKTNEPTAELNGAGQAFLRNIARRLPFPDSQLWLQYPYDVTDPAKRDQMIAERKVAIRNFLTIQTKLSGGDHYQIDVHDLVQPTYPSAWTQKAYNGVDIQGKLPGANAGGSSGSSTK